MNLPESQYEQHEPQEWIGTAVLRDCGGGLVFLVYTGFTVAVMLVALAYLETPFNLAMVLSGAVAGGILLPAVRRRMVQFLAILVCTFLVLLTGEAVFRLRYFGLDAIVHPFRYTPVANANVPGMVIVSDDPALGYEHRPGFEGLLKGKPVRINQWGYRDREFSLTRSDDTLRIVVLGDSFAMASGSRIEDAFSRQLERQLRDRGTQADVFNLAVAGYSLEQIGRVLETDVIALKPDVVLLAVLSGVVIDRRQTEQIDWQRVVEKNQTLINRATMVRYYSFLRNTLPPVTVVERRLESIRAKILREPVERTRSGLALPALLNQMRVLGNAHRFEPIFVALCLADFRESAMFAHDQYVLKIAEMCAPADVRIIDTAPYLPNAGISTDYILYPGDLHPNARTNALYAQAVVEGLLKAGLIPASPHSFDSSDQ